MADLAFDVEFDGPALEQHEMSVNDLAPALLALGDVFEALNAEAHPEDPPVTINVRATTEGSFHVQLRLVYDQVVGMLTSPEATAGANLIALVQSFGSALGLMGYLGRHRDVDETPARDGSIRYEAPDGTTFEAPAAVSRAVKSPRFRHSVNEVVRPVGSDGIEAVRVVRDEVVIGEVTKDDLPAFAAIGEPDRDMLATSTRDVYLQILNVAFQEGRKWRFHDGRSSFYATVADETFAANVDSGEEAFAKHDVLHCTVREEQWRDENGLHIEVEVLKVHEHQPRAQQANLFGTAG